MKQMLKLRSPLDDIDGLVDGVLADPSRAQELERVLRSRLRAVETSAPEVVDDDDLWNNVPV